jgi:transposase
MANQLSMADLHSIGTLRKSGTSCREIARLLDIDRRTVAKYVARLEHAPNAPPGSVATDSSAEPAPAIASQNGPASCCEPFRDVIVAALERSLSAQRIHQDLVREHGFTAKYHSVRRYVRRLLRKTELPVRRMEVDPGAEAQVDFGTGAPVKSENGKLRRPWVFRIVLSASRKGYSEAVWRQTTEAFVGALENAFRLFGGVPRTLVIDNLKAVVKRGDWYDPEVHPKLQSFAAHYGTVFLPTKPYTPEHKGKIESGVKYVKNNALRARVFDSLQKQNEFLLDWELSVADTRIHGTTRRHVRQVFESIERPALGPLPVERFPFFHEGRRSVHRDGYVEVDKAYYSAPPEYVGRHVWARWDSRLVRLFNDRWGQLAIHAKTEPGRFCTDPRHIPREKVSAVERGTDALLRQAAAIGPHAGEWSAAMVQARGVQGVRVLVGLKALAGKHTPADIDRACQAALAHGAFRLRTIRELLRRQADAPQQQQFEFLAEHPVIRPLSDYSLDSLLQFRKERFDERDIG